MRTLIAMSLAALLTLAIADVAAGGPVADPLEGRWKSDRTGREVEVVRGSDGILRGRTVRAGSRQPCAERNVDWRLTHRGDGRYDGPVAFYRTEGDKCQERLNDGSGEFRMADDEATMTATYTPPPPTVCSFCAEPERWQRISRPRAQLGCPKTVFGGTDGDDEFVGTSGPEMILMFRGHDRATGNAADDCLFGHQGDDILRGHSGDDFVDGGTGTDQLLGESGDDTLVDHRDGGGSITGGGGRDDINVRSSTARVRIDGGDGADRITVLKGRTRVFGGPGADAINTRNKQNDVVSCGAARDRAVIDRRDVVRRDCERVDRP
jgi:hypothetical protein